jgi:acetyl-CoA C-acetyltransferase
LGALVLKEALRKVGLRPQTGAELQGFEPDALKGLGLTDLEKNAYDYDASLQPVQIDEVITGNVLPAAQGQNTARQSLIGAGIPKETTAFTINKLCASGMKAVALGTQAISNGDAEVVLAGGMETMSMVPYAVPTERWGARMGDVVVMADLLILDGLQESFYGYHMGITAENIAEKCGIPRQEQDKLGVLSHQRARKSIAEGLFKDEIVAGPDTPKEGRPHCFRYRRAADGHQHGEDGEAVPWVQEEWDGDRGKLLRH